MHVDDERFEGSREGAHIHIVGVVWRRRLLLSGAVLLIAAVGLFAVWEPPKAPRPTAGEQPAGASAATPARPNIVLLVIDTLRADAVGAYGQPLPASPELDRLAEGGLRFARAVTQTAWTRPSFASFLTSRYPRDSGIVQEAEHGLPQHLVTLPEVLSQAGYTTLGVTANPNINSTFRFDQGFDAYVDSGVDFDPKVPLRSAREIFSETLALLDEHQRPDRPVYLQAVVMDVHDGRAGPNQSALRRQFRQSRDAYYLAALRYVSSEVQQFLQALRKRPGFDNTLLVLTSDHGEGLHSHPHVTRGNVHGHVVYESQTIVPWILNDFGHGLIPAGKVVEQPVRLLDLMPTVLDLVSVPGPAGMEGRSLRPTFAGQTVPLPDRFVVETHFRGTHAIGVYGDGFAYVEHRSQPMPGTLPVELQRLGGAQDGARTDLSGRYPQVRAQLQAYLRSWERTHPQAAPSLTSGLSDNEFNLLRALGYVE